LSSRSTAHIAERARRPGLSLHPHEPGKPGGGVRGTSELAMLVNKHRSGGASPPVA
jgi:hypothetical protein